MITTVPRKLISELVECVVEGGARKATKILSPKLVVKATYQGKRGKNDRTRTVVVTLGAPNYAERAIIKALGKARFPRPIQVRWDKVK